MLFWSIGDAVFEHFRWWKRILPNTIPYAVLEHALCCFGAFLSWGWWIPQSGMVHSSVGNGAFLSWGCWIPTFHDLGNVISTRLTHANISVRQWNLRARDEDVIDWRNTSPTISLNDGSNRHARSRCTSSTNRGESPNK